MHTSQQWWDEVKNDDTKLTEWLRRQYVGEMSAVNLLSQILLRFGADATEEQWGNVYSVMLQEARHAFWMKQVLVRRGIPLEKDARAETRYWAEVVPNIHTFADAMSAAFHAESMRLERICIIAAERDPRFLDLTAVFARILPDEEWHAKIFGEMRGTADTSAYHQKGLEALNLVLA